MKHRSQDYHATYNCYHEDYETFECEDCVYNIESTAEKKVNKYISMKDKLNILYRYLKGEELPDGVTCKTPKLDSKAAFSVIWFLQEIMHCLPENIERCDICGDLYDTDSEGYRLDDQWKLDGETLPKKYWGSFCSDSCAPQVDFELK